MAVRTISLLHQVHTWVWGILSPSQSVPLCYDLIDILPTQSARVSLCVITTGCLIQVELEWSRRGNTTKPGQERDGVGEWRAVSCERTSKVLCRFGESLNIQGGQFSPLHQCIWWLPNSLQKMSSELYFNTLSPLISQKSFSYIHHPSYPHFLQLPKVCCLYTFTHALSSKCPNQEAFSLKSSTFYLELNISAHKLLLNFACWWGVYMFVSKVPRGTISYLLLYPWNI